MNNNLATKITAKIETLAGNCEKINRVAGKKNGVIKTYIAL
jgi:hypothetical protein